MVFWIFLVIALLLTATFALQSLAMYLCTGIRRRRKAHEGVPHGVLLPEIIALEAQFFLAPKRALAEARELLAAAGASPDCLAKVADQASFSQALQQSQAMILCQSAAVARAARTVPLK
jgi:hypothetical protein